MRVIAGRFRSRKLKSVPGLDVRPTPDRMRESLFSILMPRLTGAVFLDAYAGSGAVGIEALSRGAGRVVLIEKNAGALAVIQDNLLSLNIGSEALVLRGSVIALLPKLLEDTQPDIVFLDPPYERTKEYTEAMTILGRGPAPYVIAQHSSRLTLADRFERLAKIRVVKQGDNTLSFYAPDGSTAE